MANWQTIEELKNIFIRKYTNSELGSELEKACSEEYELKRDYNGRQILELLQNVDDACKKDSDSPNKEVSVKIVFKDNILEVGNTGTTFSQETIERLCLGRASDKSSENIGSKGTGFRSLLNDAEWIEVHSGDFSIRFSEQYARDQFKEYIDKSSEKFNALIYHQLVNWKKKDYDLCFPVMNCPEQVEKYSSAFDTLIRVKIKEGNSDKASGIVNQLRQPFYKSLLFLPNITKIEIAIDEECEQYKKESNGNQIILSEPQNKSSRYYVAEKRARITSNKVANLIVAIPLEKNYDFTNEKLYCYFPIRDCKTPVNALIHAPFLTNNSRDDVPNDNEQINTKIFIECLKFLREIAERVINDKSFPADLAIRMVTPTNNFIGKVWDKDSFNLKQFYLELLANAKLLPTVNGEYVSVSDKPKCFDDAFPEEFKGNQFKELLIELPKPVYNFVKNLASSIGYYSLEYTTEELEEKINTISDNLNIPLRVKIFLWWNNRFHSAEQIPHLLQDTTKKWIIKETKIYLPTDSGVSILPEQLSWVNLCILDQSYVDELIKQLKDLDKWTDARSKLASDIISNKRILDKISDLYFCVKFTEQSNSDLVIEEINRQIDTSEKAISFINWFYAGYKNRLQINSSRFNINYKLPDRDGNLKQTRYLFFGKEYGNELAEKIFDKSKYFAVADLDTMFAEYGDKREEVINFLKNCGVRFYPKVEQVSLTGYNNAGFADYLKKKYNSLNSVNYITTKCVDGFEDALKVLDTSEVVQWITSDIELYNLIVSTGMTGHFSQKINYYGTVIYDNEYICFILNNAKWIKVGDKKYAPNEIVKYSKLKDKIDGIYGISERELINILNKQVVQGMKLDFIDSLASFPDHIIKKILLQLPKDDKHGEISRALYEDIIRLKKGILPTYSTSDLKVLAKDGNYYVHTAVKYADRRLPKAVSDSTCLIDIGSKRNTVTIKNWLGVERYKMNLDLVDWRILSYLSGFENEISDIKIVALSILDERADSNIQPVKNIKIIPCEYILVKDAEKENEKFELDYYNYIKKDGKYYIKIPLDTSLEKIRGALDYRTSVTEIFEDAIGRQIDSDRFAYLLFNDEKGKKEIIKDQYGIDKWNEVYELLYQSKRLNGLIIKFFRDNALNEQMMHDLENIDFLSDLSIAEFNILKDALNVIEKDVQDINDVDEQIRLDIRPYLKAGFSNYRDSFVEIYRINCYQHAVKNEDLQKTFLEDCDTFRCFDLDINSIENRIFIDYEEILKVQFNKFDTTVNCPEINIDERYTSNYNSILRDGDFTRDELDLYLQTKPCVKSMLYFGISKNIIDEFKSFVVYEREKSVDIPQKDVLNGNNSGIETSTVETMLLPINTDNYGQNGGHNVKSEKSPKGYEKEAANKEKVGKNAEQIAYTELKKNYHNLIWHSKNSDVPADRNRGPVDIVCDMWNTDSNNVKTYFEIKSATTEFEMSINEYNSMQSAPDEYVVVLVDIATKEISKHKLDELETLKQVSKYRFCFKQIKKRT